VPCKCAALRGENIGSLYFLACRSLRTLKLRVDDRYPPPFSYLPVEDGTYYDIVAGIAWLERLDLSGDGIGDKDDLASYIAV
jgi:hypothetical protein